VTFMVGAYSDAFGRQTPTASFVAVLELEQHFGRSSARQSNGLASSCKAPTYRANQTPMDGEPRMLKLEATSRGLAGEEVLKGRIEQAVDAGPRMEVRPCARDSVWRLTKKAFASRANQSAIVDAKSSELRAQRASWTTRHSMCVARSSLTLR
jgi:hypothetical protein